MYKLFTMYKVYAMYRVYTLYKVYTVFISRRSEWKNEDYDLRNVELNKL